MTNEFYIGDVIIYREKIGEITDKIPYIKRYLIDFYGLDKLWTLYNPSIRTAMPFEVAAFRKAVAYGQPMRFLQSKGIGYCLRQRNRLP